MARRARLISLKRRWFNPGFAPAHPCALPSSPAPIQVLTVDDHPLMREGIAAVIGRQTDMAVVGEAKNGSRGVELFRQLQPDVTLMDLQMPSLDGLLLGAVGVGAVCCALLMPRLRAGLGANGLLLAALGLWRLGPLPASDADLAPAAPWPWPRWAAADARAAPSAGAWPRTAPPPARCWSGSSSRPGTNTAASTTAAPRRTPGCRHRSIASTRVRNRPPCGTI